MTLLIANIDLVWSNLMSDDTVGFCWFQNLQPEANDVALVAQLSMDRLQMLESLCQHWEGKGPLYTLPKLFSFAKYVEIYTKRILFSAVCYSFDHCNEKVKMTKFKPFIFGFFGCKNGWEVLKNINRLQIIQRAPYSTGISWAEWCFLTKKGWEFLDVSVGQSSLFFVSFSKN